MTNGDVYFTTKFRLDLSPKRVIVTDTIDYAGLEENPTNFKGVLRIAGPGGVIYENTDFNDPDIDPGTSKESTKQINLPLDPGNNYEVFHGQYTVKYTVQKTTTEDEYYKSEVYGFAFNEPTMTVNVDSGPYSAKLRSSDNTEYGSNIDVLTREHRIKYPTDLGFPDIVVTTASHEVDPIYTNEWTTIISTTVDYKQLDNLEYKWYGTKTVTHCVTGACISSFYNGIDEMFTKYQAYIGTSPNMTSLFGERLQRINTAWQLLDIAWADNNVEEADRHSETIREVLEASGIDMCPTGSPSAQVSPCV